MNRIIPLFQQITTATSRAISATVFPKLHLRDGHQVTAFSTSTVDLKKYQNIIHTSEERRQLSARYMESNAYTESYGNEPVWKYYRRNFIGQRAPRPRKTCTRKGLFTTGNPCPMCRDIYLVFDYRNTKLLKQFLDAGTGEPFSNRTTNICGRQQRRLEEELIRAQEHGYLLSYVPVKEYDYEQYHAIADQIRKQEQTHSEGSQTKQSKIS